MQGPRGVGKRTRFSAAVTQTKRVPKLGDRSNDPLRAYGRRVATRRSQRGRWNGVRVEVQAARLPHTRKKGSGLPSLALSGGASTPD
jgi:hypothetical protein